jgi:hypothetical protein
VRLFLTFFFLLAGIVCLAQPDDKQLVVYGNFPGYGVRSAGIEEILANTRMKCLEKKCKVVSFDICGINPGKEYIGPYRSDGDTMNDAQKRYVRSLVTDSKLWICNIVVRYKDGTERVLGKGDTEYSIYFFTIK